MRPFTCAPVRTALCIGVILIESVSGHAAASATTRTPSFTPTGPTPTRTPPRTFTCTRTRTGTRPPSPTPCSPDQVRQCVPLDIATPTPCSTPGPPVVYYKCTCEACPPCTGGEVRDCPPHTECDCRCALPTLSPTATLTAPPTASLTAVPTATPPRLTPSVTPTSSPRPCPGDCDRDGVVDVTEIVRVVAVSLHSLPPSACSGYEAATIADLIRAVTAVLRGCDVARSLPDG
jgi:hypothetical protein